MFLILLILLIVIFAFIFIKFGKSANIHIDNPVIIYLDELNSVDVKFNFGRDLSNFKYNINILVPKALQLKNVSSNKDSLKLNLNSYSMEKHL